MKAAIEKEEGGGAEVVPDERKRKYNSFAEDKVTAEDMEAYHRSKLRADDPMANYYQDGEQQNEVTVLRTGAPPPQTAASLLAR